MAHYDTLTDPELETACPPKTMRAMEALGMKALPTESHRWGVFAGYGLTLQIPSDMELDVPGAMRLIVEKARAEGAKEWKKAMRKMLEL